MSETLRRFCLTMVTIAIVGSVYPAWAAGGGPSCAGRHNFNSGSSGSAYQGK